jgi:hypothetical protein
MRHSPSLVFHSFLRRFEKTKRYFQKPRKRRRSRATVGERAWRENKKEKLGEGGEGKSVGGCW